MHNHSTRIFYLNHASEPHRTNCIYSLHNSLPILGIQPCKIEIRYELTSNDPIPVKEYIRVGVTAIT